MSHKCVSVTQNVGIPLLAPRVTCLKVFRGGSRGRVDVGKWAKPGPQRIRFALGRRAGDCPPYLPLRAINGQGAGRSDSVSDEDSEKDFGKGPHIYPSRRSFSKASSLSLSWARPERSEVLVWRSSAMISLTVWACDLIGKVHGAQPRLR